jgi:hypothetical protein
MLKLSTPSISDQLSLDDTIDQLIQSSLVDGIAEFGSRSSQHFSAASDYDLLILLTHIPIHVFQMLTTIQGRLADIVLVETEMADRLLANGDRPVAMFETLFARKMQTALICYDRSGRLHRIQKLVSSPDWNTTSEAPVAIRTWPRIWFWQSFGLLQLERMAQSHDPMHGFAVDMLLTACLAGTWRSYFEVRALAWDGEKAALRYWMEHDIAYYQTVQLCLGAVDRNERLIAYRTLVQQTIQPIGPILRLGETAVALAQAENEWTDVEAILRYWNSLFSA